MQKKGLKRQKAEELVSAFPNTGNAPLAEILLKENPILFNDKEDARITLRIVRGSAGTRRRTFLKTEPVLFPNGKRNPYNLPDEDHNNFTPLHIETDKLIRVGIISDLHIPYQANTAVELALDKIKKGSPSILILNGDIMDCYQSSDFVKDPNKRDLKEEVEVTKEFLKSLKKAFPDTRIIFKEGNHELRHRDYLARKAPLIFGFETTKLNALLGLEDMGIEWLDNKRLIQLGKLTVVHGHEFGRAVFSPVNPARGFYARAKNNVIGGHHHQTHVHSAKTITGDQHVAHSIGCLCDLSPNYLPINEWCHGFAEVELEPGGDFIVHNQKIIKNKIINA